MMKIKLQKSECIVCEKTFNYIKGFKGEKDLCIKCYVSYMNYEKKIEAKEKMKESIDLFLQTLLVDIERNSDGK